MIHRLLALGLALILLAALVRLEGAEPVAEADGAWPLPIFVLSAADQAAGNGLLALFIARIPSGLSITCVFADEDHPVAGIDESYDLYRLSHFGRIADVETLSYQLDEPGVPATPDRIRFAGTYAGDQTYDVPIAEHHSATLPIDAFDVVGGRPLIHVTTWNHLFRERATDPALGTVRLADTPVYAGDRAAVEALLTR